MSLSDSKIQYLLLYTDKYLITKFKVTLRHFSKHTYSLSCRESGKKNDTTLMSVWYIQNYHQLAYLSTKTGNGEAACLALSKNNKIHLPAPVKLTNKQFFYRTWSIKIKKLWCYRGLCARLFLHLCACRWIFFLPLERARLIVSNFCAKLTGCWPYFHI